MSWHVRGLEQARNSLSKVTMYRLVTILLAVLAVAAFGYAAAGSLIPVIFTFEAMALTLVVLAGVSVLTDWLLGRLFKVQVHLESALITGLLLWFLYWPTAELAQLAWLAAIAATAQLSKFVLVVHRRHLFNPVAAGVIVSLVFAHFIGSEAMPYPTWWIANASMAWLVIFGAVLLWWRTGRIGLGATFAGLAIAISVVATMSSGLDLTAALRFAVVSSPIFFFGGFMLTEPLTLPPRKWQKLVAGVLAALVVTWPLVATAAFGEAKPIWIFASTYELALVVTGLFALACRQQARSLELVQRRPLGEDYFEYTFTAERPVAFVPGQYGEFYVPHRADRRGQRRMFSFVSAPGFQISIAAREPVPGSSFKQALAVGNRARLTSVHGDFTWPSDPAVPLLLIAGGIGITPFVSQLRAFADQERDVVLIHAVHDKTVVPYSAEFADLGVDIQVIGDADLNADYVRAKVPDLNRRTVMISGSPAVVDAMAADLAKHAHRVKVDSFLGY